MSRALVLNTTYEPLCVVSARRAVVLVLTHKADLVSESGDAMHSERLTVSIPSIIRLRTFVRVPYRRRAALNRPPCSRATARAASTAPRQPSRSIT